MRNDSDKLEYTSLPRYCRQVSGWTRVL